GDVLRTVRPRGGAVLTLRRGAARPGRPIRLERPASRERLAVHDPQLRAHVREEGQDEMVAGERPPLQRRARLGPLLRDEDEGGCGTGNTGGTAAVDERVERRDREGAGRDGERLAVGPGALPVG